MYEIVIGRTLDDKKKLGLKGTIFLGKHYVKMGATMSLSNSVLLDVAQPHVILITGKRGSGKSHSLGVIAEEMTMLPEEIREKIAVLIFDTMGIFWTMKYPNVKDEELLEQWNLKPAALNIFLGIPAGYFEEQKNNGIPVDFSFTINPQDLTAEDWCRVFDIDLFNETGIAIERALDKLEGKDYNISEIIARIEEDKRIDEKTKMAAINRLKTAEDWNIFSKDATPLTEIIKGGQITVLDTSCYKEWSVKALVTSLICRKLMYERMSTRKSEEVKDIEKGHSYFSTTLEGIGKEQPLVWIMLDECIPYDSNINTDKGILKIGEIIKRIEVGEKIMALSYNHQTKEYEYKNIIECYKIKPRELIQLTTESGNKFRCTNDHLVLGKYGYVSAITATELAAPIEENYRKDKASIIARITGHIFGDGYLSKNKIVGFCGKGPNCDLNKIREDMRALGFNCGKIHERITTSEITNLENKKVKVVGLSQEMKASFKAWNFFFEKELPVGKKTDSDKKIPYWIMNGTKEEKAEFLAALMGSDGSGFTHAKNSKLDFNAGKLSFNKIEELRDTAWEIANQIRILFNDLGVKISAIKEGKGNIRKDGKKTIKILIRIGKSIQNTIRFLEEIGFRYNRKKERNGNTLLSYLRSYKQRLEEIKGEILSIYRLKKEGKKLREISTITGIDYSRVRMISKQVIKSKLTLKFDSFDEWSSKRVNENILFEKIKKIELLPAEDLYDITVDKNHNFIADNIITHNCHELLPKEGKTPATDALVQLLREGRQPGISMIIATQQPGEIHKDAITQADIVLSHRVTAKKDIEALNEIMQTYLTSDINFYINSLPHIRGCAIILDDNSEKIYPIQVKPKLSWHGGESPSAIKAKGKALEELNI